MATGRLRRRVSLLWNVDETVDRVTERMDRAVGGVEGVTGSVLGVPEQVRRLAGGLRPGSDPSQDRPARD